MVESYFPGFLLQFTPQPVEAMISAVDAGLE